MIYTIFDLLLQLKENGVKEIEPYLNIGHNPTIGDMYEGLTKELLEKSIFKGFNLKVSSGKIRNKSGQLSRQIDCMLVIGEGDQIPFTTDCIYEVGKVLAVIEVKKNLFTNDLASAYNNLKSVYDLVEPDSGIDISMMASTFEMITKQKFPDADSVNKLSVKNQMLYHALVVETFVPIRIVFGYDGYADEFSLRKHFVDYVESQVSDTGYAKGFGATSLPNLIICGENTLIKANGYPYIAALETDDWMVYTSYNKNPLLVFLEIIWTRLTMKFKISSLNLFGEDLDMEGLHALLVGESDGVGWHYRYIEMSKEQLKKQPEVLEWQPTFLNEVEFCLINKLCNGVRVSVNDEQFVTFVVENGYKVEDITEHLNNARLLTILDGYYELLTNECCCIITPGGFIAGDNKDNRVMNWVKRQRDKNNISLEQK